VRRLARVALLLAAAFVTGGSIRLLLRSGNREMRPSPPRLDGVARRAERSTGRAPGGPLGAGRPAPPAPATEVGPPAPSLRDTEVDGGLALDGQGHFVVTADARVFFDYFLSAAGEEPRATTRARVVAAIVARLPAPAAGAAIDLFDRYLLYRSRARELRDATDGAIDMAQRFERLRALRRDAFGTADAEALFGEEEARDRVAVEQQAIAADPGLGEAERTRRLDALQAELPASVREARAAAVAPLMLEREEAALRAAGGSAEEIRTLRERSVGAEAADRLADVDRQRAQWAQRLEEYRAARAAIEADSALAPEARAASLEALLTSRFDATERLRVAALERLAAPAAR
jgi:lipase chaperone LimK